PKPKRGGVELGAACCFAQAPSVARITITMAGRTLRLEPEGDRSVALHTPRPDVIEMVGSTEPSGLAQLVEGGLRVVGLIHRATQQERLRTLPFPHAAESRVALGEDRILQLGGGPAAPTVGADVDAPNATAPAPREPRDLPPSLVGEHGRKGRERDDRF